MAGDPDPRAQHQKAVILVEDDAGLRVALLRVLRASGFAALAYEDAEALLADAALERSDCLVVDLNLPGMSGLDLIDLLRRRGSATPMVAISAHDEPRVRAAARGRGAERFLGKPFLGTTLVKTLDELLGARPAAHTRA